VTWTVALERAYQAAARTGAAVSLTQRSEVRFVSASLAPIRSQRLIDTLLGNFGLFSGRSVSCRLSCGGFGLVFEHLHVGFEQPEAAFAHVFAHLSRDDRDPVGKSFRCLFQARPQPRAHRDDCASGPKLDLELFPAVFRRRDLGRQLIDLDRDFQLTGQPHASLRMRLRRCMEKPRNTSSEHTV